ncbi:MAG: hypothetical protein ACI36Z_09245 [Alloprevotella sp.]
MNCIKTDRQLTPKSCQTKASALTNGGHGCGNHSDMDYLIILYEK